MLDLGCSLSMPECFTILSELISFQRKNGMQTSTRNLQVCSVHVCVCKLAREPSVYLWLPSITKTFCWANWIESNESRPYNRHQSRHMLHTFPNSLLVCTKIITNRVIFKVATMNDIYTYTYIYINMHMYVYIYIIILNINIYIYWLLHIYIYLYYTYIHFWRITSKRNTREICLSHLRSLTCWCDSLPICSSGDAATWIHGAPVPPMVSMLSISHSFSILSKYVLICFVLIFTQKNALKKQWTHVNKEIYMWYK